MQQVNRNYSGTDQIRLEYLEPPEILRELAGAAGVRFNGTSPWDIQVHDGKVYQRILTQGSLGFGESYVDGMWDSFALDELFHHLLSADA